MFQLELQVGLPIVIVDITWLIIWKDNSGIPDHNVSTTLFFVACTLHATTTMQYLPMQNGQVLLTEKFPFNQSGSNSWKMGLPGSTSELTQIVSPSTHLSILVWTENCCFRSMLPSQCLSHWH